MSIALEFKGVQKKYRKRVALDGLDLSVPQGSIFGLVGSNGAGKTTSLLVATGLVRMDSGSVNMLGQGAFDPTRLQGRVSLMPQDCELPPHALVAELLSYYARMQGLTALQSRQSAAAVLEWCHLSDRATAPIRTLSHGMRRRVLIAQAFLGHPDLVLLDEPLSGLDPREVVNIRDMLVRRRGQQTIVISSHNLFEMERVCDRLAFIEGGRTIREGAMESITGKQQMLQYVLKGKVPLQQLRELLPDARVELAGTVQGHGDPASGSQRLICRYNAAQWTPEEVSKKVLMCLLSTDVGILEVTRGSGLEDAYLNP